MTTFRAKNAGFDPSSRFRDWVKVLHLEFSPLVSFFFTFVFFFFFFPSLCSTGRFFQRAPSKCGTPDTIMPSISQCNIFHNDKTGASYETGFEDLKLAMKSAPFPPPPPPPHLTSPSLLPPPPPPPPLFSFFFSTSL